jgi:hypothetical protein
MKPLWQIAFLTIASIEQKRDWHDQTNIGFSGSVALFHYPQIQLFFCIYTPAAMLQRRGRSEHTDQPARWVSTLNL